MNDRREDRAARGAAPATPSTHLPAVFLDSLRLYAAAFGGAFTARARRQAPLGFRRLAVLLLGFPPFLALQLLHWLGFALDECLFRGYRRIEVQAPLFVTGVPRSGTTFVHRSLAADETQFTSLRTWEALLAPSITERYLYKAIGAADRALGSPARRGLTALMRRLGGDFDAVHPVGLWDAEEDYLALLPAAGCFILVLAFPGQPAFWDLGRFERMPPARQQRLMRYYRACLQKHLYVEGRGRRLLSKNAAFGSWVAALRDTFPDARFLVCVREPLAALSSQLSAIDSGRRLFGTDPGGEHYTAQFSQWFADSYAGLARQLRRSAPGRIAVIEQAELSQQPQAVLQQALAGLGLKATLAAAAHAAPSRHRHHPLDHGLSADTIGRRIRDAYLDILRHRTPPPAPLSPP